MEKEGGPKVAILIVESVMCLKFIFDIIDYFLKYSEKKISGH